MKIVIFGTGEYYQKYKFRFDDCHIVALADNDKLKQGNFLDGLKIISANDIKYLSYDYIAILVKYYDTIKEQLIQLGVEPQKILTLKPDGVFSTFRKAVELDDDIRTSEILLVSHDMHMQGAPLMLFSMAKILKGIGYQVAVIGTGKGSLTQCYSEEGIPVAIYDDLCFSNKEIRDIFFDHKLIIANTITESHLIGKLSLINVPVVWWLHEEWGLYESIRPLMSIDVTRKNLFVYGVGERAVRAFKDYYGRDKEIRLLTWGIPDSVYNNTREHDNIIVAIIGYCSHIKGQDLLLDLCDKYKNNINQNFEFWLIGTINTEQRKKFESCENIKVYGEIPHDELLELYKDIDVVLSISRADTLPVVLVEGMANHKLVVTSTGTGLAEYITNHENGLVFANEDIDALYGELMWLLENRSEWDMIRKNGHDLFLQNFSLKSFKDSIEQMLKTAW